MRTWNKKKKPKHHSKVKYRVYPRGKKAGDTIKIKITEKKKGVK